MQSSRNVLWIMADQLRWDYLSCYGHPHLHTPHLDRLAERGVRFDRAYIQSPFCGPSRASYYTGRYVRSHGASWNGFPVAAGEHTIGDHLGELGVRTALVGKTHMVPDTEGMRRLGIDPNSEIGVRVSQCGFESYVRDDGLHPYGPFDLESPYQDYLRSKGFDGPNPWEDWANSGEDADGNPLSAWLVKYSNLEARIPNEHAETPYMTRKAMEFMEEAGDQPWLCHLSLIKPHWPHIVSSPYHDMYGPEHILPAIRNQEEVDNGHPIFKEYTESRICTGFSREEARQTYIPAYMGLIKQIDDQMGLLFEWMDSRGLLDNTMIVFSSDHGDYLGDHWMGEKDLWHEQSIRVPLIIYDPRPEANATRGTVSNAFVEGIDLIPTFLSYFAGKQKPHILEGRDLTPLLSQGDEVPWRDYVIAEYDYATRPARRPLGVNQEDARLIMIRNERWKYVHCEGFRPVLFDLENDPEELTDLGSHPDYSEIRATLHEAIFEWSRRHHNRTTLTAERIEFMTDVVEPPGILIGVWDEQEFESLFNKPFSERP